MKHDIERLAPAPDWCSPAAYRKPIPDETLDHIERELAKLIGTVSTPQAAARHALTEIPAYFWFALLAVLAVTLL